MIKMILLIIVTSYALYLTIGVILMETSLNDAIDNLTLDDKDIVYNSREYIKMCLRNLFKYILLTPACVLSYKISSIFKNDY